MFLFRKQALGGERRLPTSCMSVTWGVIVLNIPRTAFSNASMAPRLKMIIKVNDLRSSWLLCIDPPNQNTHFRQSIKNWFMDETNLLSTIPTTIIQYFAILKRWAWCMESNNYAWKNCASWLDIPRWMWCALELDDSIMLCARELDNSQ